MDKLEQYIRVHARELDSALPPAAAEEDFLQRWEAAEKGKSRKIYSFWSTVAAAVIVLALLPWKQDSFRGVQNNPDAIYEHYLAAVADAWTVLGTDEEASAVLSNLTEEAIPLRDQLPEELSPEEQSAILRAHYGDLLAGVDKLMKTIKQ